ncbi:MAG: two-component hybrid sensor and regulator [Parcubacteria group bacterium GW2011_GWC1_38_6]|nr:MAG: two-component hybrid sensor and regulator [Parcubacteria group bacterium GW2011_GWC1_38_6]
MKLKEAFNYLFFGQCKRYGVSIWQCPQFLFLIMGLIIMGTSIGTFLIGNRYVDDPIMVVFIVLLSAAILFIMAFFITNGFEKLAEANRMKTEFVGIVSHQLRAPLSNLKWSIELLMSGGLGKIEEKQKEYFQILEENSSRMHELISDLLVVSRMETTGFFSHKASFSLIKLVKETIKEFDIFTKSSNIKIDFDYPSKKIDTLADSPHIKLVVENLIDNAIRYAKKGGNIQIKAQARKDKIYLEIKDDGVGIPKNDQRYIFQKFFRAQNALKHQTQGSGLGLYIAKTMIEKSNGKIGFNSKENEGSTFWFTLPLAHKS